MTLDEHKRSYTDLSDGPANLLPWVQAVLSFPLRDCRILEDLSLSESACCAWHTEGAQ